jgi:hypothetical protein
VTKTTAQAKGIATERRRFADIAAVNGL